jgi:predicted 3-demethylubiquinone-9 3-methyltransferase (glyoxalase superfamily)
MQKITTFLWFEDQAEEAANFYVSVFKNSKILQITHCGENAPRPVGSVLTVRFQLDGQEYIALNGGPQFKFTEAISLVVNCETQAEIDEMWQKLSDGGEEVECGWVKDRYGLSWQIVPSILWQLVDSSDPDKASRVFQAVWHMKKIDIETLKRAALGEVKPE